MTKTHEFIVKKSETSKHLDISCIGIIIFDYNNNEKCSPKLPISFCRVICLCRNKLMTLGVYLGRIICTIEIIPLYT